MLLLFWVYLEIELFFFKCNFDLFLYSWETRIRVFVSGLCKFILVSENPSRARRRGSWQEIVPKSSLLQRKANLQKTHLKELSPVGMVGSGLTISPEEHANRKTGKQMEPWDREREECEAGELSKLASFFPNPRSSSAERITDCGNHLSSLLSWKLCT